jgi:hypothetical protein
MTAAGRFSWSGALLSITHDLPMQCLPARTWGLGALGIFFAGALSPACTRSQSLPRELAEAPPVGTAQLAIAVATATPKAMTVEQKPRATAPADCPKGMLLVEGDYCPEVEQDCLEWLDPKESRYHHFRCARYAPSVCKSKARVHMRYCIDETERAENETGAERLPRHFMSWTSSKNLCESEGARLCRESEWVFACEGEEMRPYPYGWERNSEACNVDLSDNIGKPGRLVDHRSPVGSHDKCKSPFGVQDLAGNVEEWVRADGQSKMGWKEVLKGSWWIPSRHACRQFQIGHNDVYSGAETGTRCCKDAPPREAP